jgi:hypothetical protein
MEPDLAWSQVDFLLEGDPARRAEVEAQVLARRARNLEPSITRVPFREVLGCVAAWMAAFGPAPLLLGIDVAVPHWTPALAAMRAAQQAAAATFANVVAETVVRTGGALHQEAEVRPGIARDVLARNPRVTESAFRAWMGDQLQGPPFAEQMAATEAALTAALVAGAQYASAVRRAAYPPYAALP